MTNYLLGAEEHFRCHAARDGKGAPQRTSSERHRNEEASRGKALSRLSEFLSASAA